MYRNEKPSLVVEQVFLHQKRMKTVFYKTQKGHVTLC